MVVTAEEARAVAEAMEVEVTPVAEATKEATEVEVIVEATDKADTNPSLSLSTSVSPMAPTATGSD